MSSATSLARSIDRRHGFVRLLLVGTLLLDLFVVGMVALVVDQDREREVAQAEVLTENYSKMLEAALVGFFARIDITAQTVKDEVERQLALGGIDEKALATFLARQHAHIPETRGLRVVDAQGIVRHASPGLLVLSQSAADNPQFIRLRDDPDAGLVFSKPFLGRASGKWLISLGRRVNHPDGSFAGNIHVAVAIEQFLEMFSRTDLGPQGIIGLWDQSSLIARYSRADAEGGSVGSTTPSARLRALLDADSKAAAYRAKSEGDGILRTSHFRKVDGYPLYLVVGLAEADYLDAWRTDTTDIVGLAGLFVAFTLLSACAPAYGPRMCWPAWAATSFW
jgi:hypothetical protein